jgi:tRNA A37 methylthiotransferase MiaB
VLREVAAAHGRRFRAALVGHTEDALVLETRDRASGDLVGLAGNFVEVRFAGPDHLQHRLARVRVTAAGDDAVHGVLEDSRAA